MQIPELRRKAIAVIAAAAMAGASQMPTVAADLPVKTVTLYKHGVAFFEREGAVADGEAARLHFKTSVLIDLL
jgi:ABC-type sugar transport system substrate-binding protein